MIKLDASTHTWLAARGLILNRCDDFYRQLILVRENFDPEAIHDLRVASRRLREGITLFANCFRKKQLLPLRRELKTFTGRLGAIRNIDEAILFFTSLQQEVAAPAAAIQSMVDILRINRDIQRRTLKRELKNLDPGALLGRMDGMCNNPLIFNTASRRLFEPINTILLEAIAARGLVLEEILPEALVAENITAQHRLRIAVKRFRYRLEFLAPLASAGYKEVYAAVKGFQEVLGQMHDLDVFAALAAEKIPEKDALEAVTALITDHRKLLFAQFQQQNQINPLPSLSDKVRNLL